MRGLRRGRAEAPGTSVRDPGAKAGRVARSSHDLLQSPHQALDAFFDGLGRQRAVSASHQEAVRFAAFTVNKTVHDAAADWGPPIVAAMAGLRDALHAKGHEF